MEKIEVKKLLAMMRTKEFKEEKARKTSIVASWLEGFERALALVDGQISLSDTGIIMNNFRKND